MKKPLLKNNLGMTLVELMISMTIFSIVISSVFLTIQYMSMARVNTAHRMNLAQELYFFQEKFFTLIKNNGTLDFEEYWNRKTIGTETENGHYKETSGFGNYGREGNVGTSTFGSEPYLCRSGNSSPTLWNSGCLTKNLNNSGNNQNGIFQRYGQYKLQFIDHNYNKNSDEGDEDNDGNIQGDEDDKNLLDGPAVYSGPVAELYLIKPEKKERIALRWIIKQDPDNKKDICTIDDGSDNNENISLSEGCLGNIQTLKMHGKDIGWQHDGSSTSAYDGVIDTWVCDESWQCNSQKVGNSGEFYLATGEESKNQWVNLFPSKINVKNLRFELYPQKDPYLAVAAPDALQWSNEISPFIHPYIRITLDLWFSYAERRAIKAINPTISSTTTINLNDFK